jgi:hypothetical protein
VSKRLSVCGWAIDGGVGRELIDAVANLPVTGAFCLTHMLKRNRFDLVPEHVKYVSGGRDPKGEMVAFLDKYRPDVMLTWESPGRWEFPEIWREKGVRWVNVIHWDWFPAAEVGILKQADLIAPNRVCQEGLEKWKLPSTVISVPLDIAKFPFRLRETANRFGMAYGAGGPFDRRSLKEVLAALEKMLEPVDLLVRAQKKCPEFRPVKGAKLITHNSYDPAEVYADFDVAVMPSKFEGVGLSIIEAQASGTPVITVDAEPMRSLAPNLLVKAEKSSVSTLNGNGVVSWTPSVDDIARAMGELRGKSIAGLSKEARQRAESYSWNNLGPAWKKYLLGE